PQRLIAALQSFGSPTAIQKLGTSKVAQASIGVVAELQSAIDAGAEPAVLGRTIEHALAQLEELLVAARTRHVKDDLVTWLTDFIAALHTMLEGTSSSTGPTTQPYDRTPLERLLSLVDPLTRAPALNPPDARRAVRSVKTALALQTDATPQL